jgi:hypothetical protein
MLVVSGILELYQGRCTDVYGKKQWAYGALVSLSFLSLVWRLGDAVVFIRGLSVMAKLNYSKVTIRMHKKMRVKNKKKFGNLSAQCAEL